MNIISHALIQLQSRDIDGEVMVPREASINVNEVTMARTECGSHLASTLGYTDDAVALVCQQPFNVCHQAVPPI